MNDFGRYEALNELSSDSVRRVLCGYDPILQRDVIVKAFPIEDVIPALKDRFCLDVQAAAKLVHPNIARIYDSGEQDSFVFIATEKLDGEDVRHFIDRQGEMCLEDKIHLMVEVCDGLAYAHRNGVIHHDIRADNIFILKSGKPKILDFAIARGFASRIGPSSSPSRDYLAPEQLRGQKGGPRSDIFSVATVFYELLTAIRPFPGEVTAGEAPIGEAPLVTDLRPELPTHLASVIAKGLSEDPAHRFQTADEFARELQDVANEIARQSRQGSERVPEETAPEGVDALEQASQTESKKRLPPPAPRMCAACGTPNPAEALLCESCSVRLPRTTPPPRRLAPAAPASLPNAEIAKPRFNNAIQVAAVAAALVLAIISIRYVLTRQSLHVASPASQNSGTASVNDVVFLEGKNSVRVVVFFSGEVKTEPTATKSPDRIFVDLAPAKLDTNLTEKQWLGKSGFLKKIQIDQTEPSRVRVALYLGSDGTVTSFFPLHDPNRLVFDVDSVQTASPVQAPADFAGAASANSGDRGGRSLTSALGLKVATVAIDPGHGGKDSGTKGLHGLVESELVLDVARRLKLLIEASTTTRVVLTRNEDVFVPLEGRTGIAKVSDADLFVSIHANWNNDSGIKGAETYSLNLSTSADVLETAARENAASQLSIHQLQDMLGKIMTRDKVEESHQLALHVQRALAGSTDTPRNRGVKQAPFVVLIGANIPAILTEIGFVSNLEDERLLKKPEYRQQIAQSLFEGIKSYNVSLNGSGAMKPVK